jgi:outer membrane receptor protein involved in Fe transport
VKSTAFDNPLTLFWRLKARIEQSFIVYSPFLMKKRLLAPKPASVSFAIALWSMFNPAHVAHAADPIELDPIQITATRKPERSFDVSQPVTTVNQAQIQERNPQVMTEALRGEAGVFFQQTGAGQGIAIVRGLKGSEVLHLVDGFRLNNAFFRTAPSQYIALLDPYNIQKIEVLRGPYATLYGPDAMGGVVSVQTEETRFKGQALQSRSHAFLHAGSHDQSRNARVTQAVGNQTVSVQAGYTYQDYGSREVGGVGQVADGRGNITLDERIGPTAYTARAYDAKVLWAISPVDELSVAYQHYGVPSLPRYNELVPGSKPITPAGSAVENPARAVSIYDNSRDFYHLRYRHTAPLAFIDTLEVHLGRQVIDDDRYDLRRNLTRQEFEQNRSTLDGLTVNALSTAGAHRLTYGIELYSA